MTKPELWPQNFEQAKALLQYQSRLGSLAKEKKMVMGYTASIQDAFATDIRFQVNGEWQYVLGEVCFNTWKLRKYSDGGYDYVYSAPFMRIDELQLKPIVQPRHVPKNDKEWHFDSFPLGGTKIALARPIGPSFDYLDYIVDDNGDIINSVVDYKVKPLIIDPAHTLSLHAQKFKAYFIFDKNRPYYGDTEFPWRDGSPYHKTVPSYFSNASLFFDPGLTSKIEEYWKSVTTQKIKDVAQAMERLGFWGGAGMVADHVLYDRVTLYLPSALAHMGSFAAGFMGTAIASLLIWSAIDKRIHPNLWREDTPAVIDDSLLEVLGMFEHTTPGRGLYAVLKNNPPIFVGQLVN